LKTVSNAPFTFNWENVSTGSYTIAAVAIGESGLKTKSSIIVKVAPKDSIIVNLHPNPTTNRINVSAIGLEQNKPLTLSIIASGGVVVKTITTINSSQLRQLDVSSLPSGIYTIKLICGDKVVWKQFAKLR
jgi:hypothetical protein